MKKQRLSISLFVLVISLLMTSSSAVLAQNTEIGDIKQSPNTYNNESVQIVGTIERFEPSTGNTTAYYVIKGDYGHTIRVNTDSDRPNTNQRYRVSGTVYINVENGKPFISEKSKSLVGDQQSSTASPPSGEEETKEQVTKQEKEKEQEPIQQQSEQQEEKGLNTNTIIIIIIGIVLIIIIVLLVTQQRSKASRAPQQPQSSNDQSKATPKAQAPPQSAGTSTVKYETFKGQNTVKVPAPQAGGETRKAIPGELVITKGSEVNKSFKLFGSQTPQGAVCSIGNETDGWESKVPGGRKDSHILVQDPTKTLSRYQAEIIFDGQKVYLKNYSSVNKTVVNSKELGENESTELKNEDVIQAGRVEFKYQK
ncbi:MAG: FHA domain-containing protein [archaeon]